jgi:hypothetical protein
MVSFKRKCEKVNVEYKPALSYKRQHPELTDNEVLSHFIPGSYVDWDDYLFINGQKVDTDAPS